MATPGPAQRFPANIIRINFPQIGGLVFFRVAQRWEGDVVPMSPRAFVKGLPWADFDMFSVSDGVADPDGTPHLISVPVSNPVNDNMLTKFLYWAQYPKVSADHNSVVPGFDTYILDRAQFTEIYNHMASRLYPLATRDEALAYFRGPGLLEGQDPDLVGVAFLNNTYQEIVVNPPSTEFWLFVAQGAAEYHVEPTPPVPIYKRDEAAVIVVNLAKLFRDVPLVSGSKPAQVKFTITMPVKPHYPTGHGATLSWNLSASAWSPKLSNPVKSFQRRDFPVEDRSTPIRGLPGAFNYEYHVPTFPHPDAFVQDKNVGEVERKVNATITFGAGSVPPKIELELAGTTGGAG